MKVKVYANQAKSLLRIEFGRFKKLKKQKWK